MYIQFNKNKPGSLADSENLKLTTVFSLKCIVEINKNVLLFPTSENHNNWPRSHEGRLFLEDVFLNHLNYFFDNILYFSDKKNHQLINSVRPLGTYDIININFSLNNKSVAAQSNPLGGLIATGYKEDNFWPKTAHITRLFHDLAAESKLLLRAGSLINSGFYQEALLIAFSVFDSKVQELIEYRICTEFNIDNPLLSGYRLCP